MADSDEQFSNLTLNGASFVSFCTGAEPPIIVKLATLSVLRITSLVGNLLVVVVFCRNKSLRTSVHYFIVNMTVSDLIILVIVLPKLIARSYYDKIWLEKKVLASILCQLAYIAWGVSAIVSILSMVMIAVDRFHAVMFALKPALITRKTCLKIIVAIWILSVAFHLECVNGLFKGIPGFQCTFMLSTEVKMMKTRLISIIIGISLIFVSAIVLTVLYISIGISLYRQKKNIHLASEIIQQRAKENRRITCMLVFVVVVFYAVWFTFGLLFPIYILDGENVISSCSLSWIVVYVLPIIYPILNPVIYYAFNEEFRKGIRKLF